MLACLSRSRSHFLQRSWEITPILHIFDFFVYERENKTKEINWRKRILLKKKSSSLTLIMKYIWLVAHGWKMVHCQSKHKLQTEAWKILGPVKFNGTLKFHT